MNELANRAQTLLTTRTFGHSLRAYDVADSTNTLAMAWADSNAPEGSVLIAEYQRAGRGRQGRRWESAPGKNLMFSIVLRPRLKPTHLGLITLAASLAVADAIHTVATPLKVSIKWPNDILLCGRKCCGMLLESVLSYTGAHVVVLGIGLNVNQDSFPPELEQRATSLLLELGRQVPRAALLARVLANFEERYETLFQDSSRICDAYALWMEGLGQVMHVQGPPPVIGTAIGVTDRGALRLQTPEGERIIHTGGPALLTMPA